MTGLFANAVFGTVCETRDGGKAVYLGYFPYEKKHKLFVQGFEYPFFYHDDGSRRGGGRYAQKYGNDLDIVKIIN